MFIQPDFVDDELKINNKPDILNDYISSIPNPEKSGVGD
jgi:hypothetical protein